MNYNTKYKFVPSDVAIYIHRSDLRHSEQLKVIKSVFEDYNSDISARYRDNFRLFCSEINNVLTLILLNDAEYNEADLILQELNNACLNDDITENLFGSYFKCVKLQLLYDRIDYRKIKLRTLLKDFGYQRRTAALVQSIEKAINALGLVTYLRDYEKCSVGSIGLDDMVMIRLK